MNGTNVKALLSLMTLFTCTKYDNRPSINMAFNGLNIKKVLYDTGSTSNFMGTQAFRKIPKELRPKQKPNNLRATCASGNNLTIKGRFEMQLTYEGRSITSDVYVVDELKNDAIVGMEAILAFPLFHSVLDNTIHVGGPVPKQMAYCRKSTTVLPLQSSVIELIVEENEKRVVNKEVLLDLEIDSLPHFRTNCALISTNEHGIAKCYVTNASKVSVEIPRRCSVGKFQFIKREDLMPLDKYLSISAIASKCKNYESINQNKEEAARIRKTFDLSHLEPRLREKYYTLLTRFADVISKTPFDLGRCTLYEHKITLKKDAVPKYSKQFSLPQAHIEFLETYVKEMVECGVLVPQNDTDWNSAVFFVPKANNGLPRCVLNYTYLNSQSKPMSYRLPLIHELIDNIGRYNGKVFTSLDMTSSFTQMPLHKDSVPLTSFHVPSMNQSFSYTTCPQGLQSCPLGFQKLANLVFKSMIPHKLSAYIDDNLIYSQSHDLHLQHLEEALLCLRKANLKINGSKCEIAKQSIKYCGYVLSENSYTLSVEHKEALERALEPRNIKEVRSFLGFMNYLKVLIPNYYKYSQCLSKLLRKNSSYKGGKLPKEASHAFHTLKNFVCTYPTLAYPRKEGKFRLYVDAASATENCGLGSALYQEQNGIYVPIGFHSRGLHKFEKNYHPWLLEMLACVTGIEKWAKYIIARDCELLTDHRPLTSIKTLKSKSQIKTLNRLEQKLLEFPQITISHCDGISNPSDFLSRSLEVNVKSIQSQPYLDPQSIIEFQKQDPICRVLYEYVQTRKLPNNPVYKRICKTFGNNCLIKNNALFVKVANDERVFVAPANMHAEILASSHIRGHGKLLKMMGLIQQSFSWPSIIRDCLEVIQHCTTCSKIAGPNKYPTVPLKPLPEVHQFGDRIHYDLYGALPEQKGKKWILVIVDEHTKFAQFYALRSKESEEVAQTIVDGWICRFGTTVKYAYSDLGREFCSKVAEQMHSILKSHHLTTFSFWPRSNSRAESVMKFITKYIKTMIESTDNWVDMLPILSLSFNTSCNEAVGNQSPFTLLFHQFPRLGILSGNDTLRHYYGDSFPDVLRNRIRKVKEIAAKHNLKYKQVYYDRYNERVKPMPIYENSLVWLYTPKRTKWDILWTGPYAVIKLTDTSAYIIDVFSMKSKFVHRDRLKPYYVEGGLPLKHAAADEVDDSSKSALLPEQQNSLQKNADTGPQNMYFDSPEVVLVSSPEAAAQHRPIKREPGASSSSLGSHIKREQVTPPSHQQQFQDTTIDIASSPEPPFLSPQGEGTPGSKSKHNFFRKHLPTLEEIASPFRSSSSASSSSSSRLTRRQAAQQNITIADQPLPGRQTAWYRQKP